MIFFFQILGWNKCCTKHQAHSGTRVGIKIIIKMKTKASPKLIALLIFFGDKLLYFVIEEFSPEKEAKAIRFCQALEYTFFFPDGYMSMTDKTGKAKTLVKAKDRI